MTDKRLRRWFCGMLAICLLLSFAGCKKLRAKRLEFTPYYSEHIPSSYEASAPTLLQSQPIPEDFDKDASTLVPYFHYAVYQPVLGLAQADAAVSAYIEAQLSAAELAYHQDSALNMDYSLTVLGDRLGQLKLFGFTCPLTQQQPGTSMLYHGIFYNTQDGTVYTMADLIDTEEQAAFYRLVDDLLYSSAQIDTSVESLSADTFAYAMTFTDTGLSLCFEAGTFGTAQAEPVSVALDYETLAPFAADTIYDLLEEDYLPLRGRKLDPNKPMIAFTFDDGPSKFSPKIAELFEQYNGLATFFVVGNRIENYQDGFLRCVSGGHEIANHTWEHKNLKTNSYEVGYDQLTKTNHKVKELTGKAPSLIRPVGGAVDDDVRQLSKDLKMPLINWDVDTLDWKSRDADAVYDACVSTAGDGSIVLFHDLYESTYHAVQRLVPYYAEKGYQFVTVSELLAFAEDPEYVYGDVYYSQTKHW